MEPRLYLCDKFFSSVLAECIVFMSLFLLHVLGYFDFLVWIFFTINIDFDRPERKNHGAKVPGSEMARERKGQGASWPGSESARVLLADSLRGANWPGSEKARYQKAP